MKSQRTTSNVSAVAPGDRIADFLREQPLSAKVATLLLQGYAVSDYGTEDLATEILDAYAADCLKAVNGKDCDPKTRMLIGAWMEQQVWLAHA